MERERRNKLFRHLCTGVTAAVVLLLLWGSFVEPNLLVVRRCTVPVPGLPPELENTRAVVIGDTHFGSSSLERWRMKRILRLALEEKPDTVWLLGDYAAAGAAHGTRAMSDEDFIRFFSGLKAPLGTYAVLGNHELWFGREKMCRLLERSGVNVIENKVVMLGGKLALAGIPDWSSFPVDGKKLNALTAGHDPLILLSHKARMATCIKAKFSGLIVAADTHGGQIRIPGQGSLKTISSDKREIAPGLSRNWGRTIFLTSGTGGHRLGFRLNCPPEIAVLTLKRGKAEI